MMKPEIVIGILSVFATLLAGSLVVIRDAMRERRVKALQRYKLLYVKVCHLRNRKTDRPVYERFIHRIGQSIPVFDETHYLAQHIFYQPQQGFTMTDRSDGIVDVQILYPHREDLIFPDKDAASQPNCVSQTITEKSTLYSRRATYYNGFQEGHDNFAMRVEVDTEEARLVVDFTSIPGCERLFLASPKASLRTADGTETQTPFEPRTPGIYSVSRKNLKQGDVIWIDFAVNWKGLSENLALSEKPLPPGIQSVVAAHGKHAPAK